MALFKTWTSRPVGSPWIRPERFNSIAQITLCAYQFCACFCQFGFELILAFVLSLRDRSEAWLDPVQHFPCTTLAFRREVLTRLQLHEVKAKRPSPAEVELLLARFHLTHRRNERDEHGAEKRKWNTDNGERDTQQRNAVPEPRQAKQRTHKDHCPDQAQRQEDQPKCEAGRDSENKR